MKAILIAFSFFFGTALAQTDYPGKPIRLIVGFAAGGISDVLGRAIAIPLSKQLGQQDACHQRRAVREAALRLDEGLQLRGDGRLDAAHAGRASFDAGPHRA